jgi:hypothetical protein
MAQANAEQPGPNSARVPPPRRQKHPGIAINKGHLWGHTQTAAEFTMIKLHERWPMRMPVMAVSLAAVFLLPNLAAPTRAQTAMTPQTTGRFTMHPVEGGMLRLDTETGGMSLCKAQTGGQWSCTTLPDERSALDQEIGRLTQENKELLGAIKRLEDLAGLPPDPTKPGRRAEAPKFPNADKLPTPEDVDKAMSYLQGMLKKFKEKLKDFEDLDGKRIERL